MGVYADSQLELSEGSDYGDKECSCCEGTGEMEESNCCGKPFVENTDLCSSCLEHADNVCPECEGSGLIPKDAEDAADEEWDAKCED